MRHKCFDNDALRHIAHIQFGPMYKQNDNVRMETDFIEIASHISKEYLDSNLFGHALKTLDNFPCCTRWCPISTPALSLPTPYLSHSSSSHLAPQVLPKSHTSGNHGALNMKSARKRLRSLLNNSDAAEDLGRYS